MKEFRNALAEMLFRTSERLQVWMDSLSDWLDDLSDRLYVPEPDQKDPPMRLPE